MLNEDYILPDEHYYYVRLAVQRIIKSQSSDVACLSSKVVLHELERLVDYRYGLLSSFETLRYAWNTIVTIIKTHELPSKNRVDLLMSLKYLLKSLSVIRVTGDLYINEINQVINRYSFNEI